MGRQALEVADIFRDHGPTWRDANRGHLSLGQLKVMSAIERCRTAALVGLQPTGLTRGGHVMRCENDACGYTAIAYNSCLMGKIRNGESGATWRAGLAQGKGSAPRAISLAPHKFLLRSSVSRRRP